MARSGFQLIQYFAVFILFLNDCSANGTKEWSTLPVYGMLANAELLNSTKCGKELTEFRQAIDKRILWSLRVIDASGRPTSGFIYGNNYWFGSKDQCEDVENRNPLSLSKEVLQNNSKYRPIEDEFPPFEVKYFVANIRHNSTMQYHIVVDNEDLIVLGMCLPASCLKDQLFTLLEISLKDGTILQDELYLAHFALVEVRDLIDDYEWLSSGRFIIMAVIVASTILLMIIGTSYDVLIYQVSLKKDKQCVQEPKNGKSLTIEDPKTLNDDNKDEIIKFKYQSFIWKFFFAFSAYSNTKIIFKTNSEDTDVPVIHGLRSLTMIWIIIIHIFLFSRDFYDNEPYFLRSSENFIQQLIFNGSLAVDTFLCFGAFLVTYLYLKRDMGKSIRSKPYNYLKIIQLYFLALLKRFIRLTPTFMAIIGLLQINMMRNRNTSLFPITERNFQTCEKNWWRNLLYIQNFFSVEDMCMNWSWYLAIDTQYYMILIFLLFLSSMYFTVAAGLLGLMFTSSLIATGVVAYIYDWEPALDKEFRLVIMVYYSPLTRIGPYFVGAITAYIVFKLNNTLHLKKKTILLFWLLGSLCNILAMFGLYPNRISGLTAAVYTALNRTVWSIGISWIIIACSTDNGGIVKSILCWKCWIPLSRLSYSAYLLNPFLILSFNFLSKSTVHFDNLANAITGLGIVIVTYICSYIVSLMFEMPYVFLLREWINYSNKRK